MNKTAKGALAATAAAALLLGGTGSLAYWTDNATVNGGSFTSGELDIAPTSGTGNPCDANWVYAPGKAKAGQTVVNFVPGDVVTKSCRFTIKAKGDNLAATPTVPATVGISAAPVTGSAPASSFNATVATAYTLSNRANFTTVPTITEADNGSTLTAAITVTIPFGTAPANATNNNDTQNVRASLADLTVTLLQTTPNA